MSPMCPTALGHLLNRRVFQASLLKPAELLSAPLKEEHKEKNGGLIQWIKVPYRDQVGSRWVLVISIVPHRGRPSVTIKSPL